MKYILIIIILTLANGMVFSQTAGDEDKEMFNRGKERDQQAIDEAVNGWWTASMKTHEQRIAWWRSAKFGMFIHWGVYSLPGGEWKGKKVGGYAEHLMRKERINRADYLQIAHQFNPVQFNADEWVLNAKKAGMNYFIITAKHHDGFAMYDSKVSDFNIIQQTPFKRDPMLELAAACKKHGVKFGFYYSHAFDWEHPNAPGNDWEYKNPGGDSLLYGGVNWYNVHPELLPKTVKYVNEKAIPQILELINKYHPDILWFDTPGKLPLSENIRIMKAIRAADANVVINGRLARSSAISFGDYKNTADRPAEFFPVTGYWEAIPTTNESYGYHQYDKSHKPVSHFIQLLAKAASRGGNLLMNIGPMGNGRMDEKDVSILRGIGKWIDQNRESIYETKVSPLALQSWGVSTQKDNRLYLHVFTWPTDGKLTIGGLTSNISKAYFLADATKKKLPVDYNIADAVISVPPVMPDTSNTVIVLEMNGSIEADSTRLVASNMPTRLLAFDAELTGKGLGYGDGKTARFFVEGWKSNNQSVSWNFRNTDPTTYKVIISYVATPETAGAYQLQTSEKTFNGQVTPTTKGNQVITKELGTVKFNVTTNEIKVVPVEIKGNELMKLLEVQLIPVVKQ